MQPAKLSLEDIGNEAMLLTQEAMSFTADLDNVRAKLPKFFKDITDFIDDKLGHLKRRESSLDKNLFIKAKESNDFMSLRNKKVPVPVGLSVTYLEHLQTLEKNQEFVDTLMKEVLIPTEKFLGSLLDNPDNMKSQIESTLTSKIAARNVDAAKAKLHDNFSKDQAQVRKYSEVIKRQGDWDVLYARMGDVEQRMEDNDIIDAVEMVTAISEYLDVIIDRLAEDPETYNMSGVTVSSLTKLTYYIASEVEFMSVHTFMFKELKTAVEKAAEEIK